MSTKYEKEDPDFARILEAPESENFRPRTRFFYSEREAEQEAYWWFLQGQNLVLKQERLSSLNVGDDDEGDEREPIPIPCCFCGRPTTWDSVYNDLCYRCCTTE